VFDFLESQRRFIYIKAERQRKEKSSLPPHSHGFAPLLSSSSLLSQQLTPSSPINSKEFANRTVLPLGLALTTPYLLRSSDKNRFHPSLPSSSPALPASAQIQTLIRCRFLSPLSTSASPISERQAFTTFFYLFALYFES